ncbi:MAG: FAD-binding protein [Desulfobacteraceae bacterium]
MRSIGLLIELKNGQVKDTNFGMATAVHAQDREIVALMVDTSVDTAKSSLETHGVTRIINIKTGCSGWNPSLQADAVAAAMEAFAIDSLVGLTSPTGRELLPRIAAKLDAPLIMDCLAIDPEARRVKTSQYSGKTIATITLNGNHFIYGLRPNAVPAVKQPANADIVDFEWAATPEDGYQVIETRMEEGGGQFLAEADIIISGGRGMKSGENFSLLDDCARHMGAAIGASRVAVDNGWVPYAMQVGQTGVKVNPKVYIAVGISGSIQHFAGMKTAKTIIAINTDENAAIMANCDYYVVGDLFEILPELEKALARAVS